MYNKKPPSPLSLDQTTALLAILNKLAASERQIYWFLEFEAAFKKNGYLTYRQAEIACDIVENRKGDASQFRTTLNNLGITPIVATAPVAAPVVETGTKVRGKSIEWTSRRILRELRESDVTSTGELQRFNERLYSAAYQYARRSPKNLARIQDILDAASLVNGTPIRKAFVRGNKAIIEVAPPKPAPVVNVVNTFVAPPVKKRNPFVAFFANLFA